ncbi:MAG: MBL fold metallo-hydrolase [Gammaproteobacteria bacterium]|nr:MBL fold metallo-hydrolase [Pseudomonadales bacterium]MBT7227444.1 MBL fold metallo-hydrolase [Gammaproteobacteria bacterium]MDC0413932.1 MBL fold metallo-hydrolase [Gammaproteobacteria bacterium]
MKTNKLRRVLSIAVTVLSLSVVSSFSYAQGNFAGVELSITPVAGNVYMVQRPGGGGNIGVQVGPDGVLLVDSLFAPLADKLVAAVKQVTDEEIRFLVNTHIHIDHVGGNENLAERGVLIFAHDNTRLRFFEQRSRFPRAGGSFVPQQPEGARPLITFNDTMSFHLNGEEVRAFLAPPAHTDGDVFVYFPESDVLHLGDVYRTTSYPIIDIYNGGSLRGTIAAMDKAIEIAGPETKIIPGHGLEAVGRDDLVEFRDMILDIQGQVLSMILEGKKLDEVMAAQPTAAYDAKWTDDPGWGPQDFVPVVYYELGGSGRLADR